METGTAASSLKTREYDNQDGESRRAHLHLGGLLRNLFGILLVFNKIGPPRPDVRIAYPTTFKLEVEICIDRKEV